MGAFLLMASDGPVGLSDDRVIFTEREGLEPGSVSQCEIRALFLEVNHDPDHVAIFDRCARDGVVDVDPMFSGDVGLLSDV